MILQEDDRPKARRHYPKFNNESLANKSPSGFMLNVLCI